MCAAHAHPPPAAVQRKASALEAKRKELAEQQRVWEDAIRKQREQVRNAPS